MCIPTSLYAYIYTYIQIDRYVDFNMYLYTCIYCVYVTYIIYKR